MTTPNRPAAVLDLPLYTYFTIPKVMKGIIPGWLWRKKMVPSDTRRKPKTGTSKKLFEGEQVDLYTLADDLTKHGFAPCYIHHQVREGGTVRVRIDWERGKPQLPKEQVLWVLMLLGRFVWDVRSYKNEDGTEFLPPHMNITSANPTERSEATCVLSAQLMGEEIALVNDPSEAQDSTNRAHRQAKALKVETSKVLGAY